MPLPRPVTTVIGTKIDRCPRAAGVPVEINAWFEAYNLNDGHPPPHHHAHRYGPPAVEALLHIADVSARAQAARMRMATEKSKRDH